MATTIIVDSGALIALLRRDDQHHQWASATAGQVSAPWQTCEAALSETFFLIGRAGRPKLAELLRRRIVVSTFSFGDQFKSTLDLLDKYARVPMSLADACLVRMTEMLTDPVLITTFVCTADTAVKVIPCLLP
jgi:predicted nucleic acid-binding protein